MKVLLLVVLLAVATFPMPASAQQVVVVCIQQVVSGSVSNCVPVSTTNPLPVTIQ